MKTNSYRSHLQRQLLSQRFHSKSRFQRNSKDQLLDSKLPILNFYRNASKKILELSCFIEQANMDIHLMLLNGNYQIRVRLSLSFRHKSLYLDTMDLGILTFVFLIIAIKIAPPSLIQVMTMMLLMDMLKIQKNLTVTQQDLIDLKYQRLKYTL